MMDQSAINLVNMDFESLSEMEAHLQAIIRGKNPLGIKEVCANILWQVKNCDEVDQYNMELDVMQTLNTEEIALFKALCEIATQLSARKPLRHDIAQASL